MLTVTITDPCKATDAGEWCNEHFGSNWNLSVADLFHNTKYHFEFHNKRQAVEFALKWQ